MAIIERWFLFTDEDGLWYWKVTGLEESEVKKRSDRGFDNYPDCYNDAKAKGFSG